MSAWTVDRDGRTLLGYSRKHGDLSLVVVPVAVGWTWAVCCPGVDAAMAQGTADGPIAGMEAADYALREVVR